MSDLSSSAAPLFSFSAVPLPGGDVKFDAVLPCPGPGCSSPGEGILSDHSTSCYFPFGAVFKATDVVALSAVSLFVDSVVQRERVLRSVDVDRDALLVAVIRAVLSAGSANPV